MVYIVKNVTGMNKKTRPRLIHIKISGKYKGLKPGESIEIPEWDTVRIRKSVSTSDIDQNKWDRYTYLLVTPKRDKPEEEKVEEVVTLEVDKPVDEIEEPVEEPEIKEPINPDSVDPEEVEEEEGEGESDDEHIEEREDEEGDVCEISISSIFECETKEELKEIIQKLNLTNLIDMRKSVDNIKSELKKKLED